MGKKQLDLPFSAIRNAELLSNHWLEHRLPLEPDWNNRADAAQAALEKLAQLWKVERARVEKYNKEAPLEEAFIQPVFQILGWKLIYQCNLRGRTPDYALFETDRARDAALAVGDANEGFWKHPTILADAKAWTVPLDRPTITKQQKEYPPEQIDWYLTNSRLDYAILTNGRLWRLVPRVLDPGQRRFQTYLECDLARLLDARINSAPHLPKHGPIFDDFLRFFLFFSPAGFAQVAQLPTLVERARKGSNIYRVGVGEDLKSRVFDALALCIEGFLAHSANALSPERDLETIRQQSLILLYRLLFILFAEDRQLLPYRTNLLYTENRSLGRFRDDIGAKLERINDGNENDYPPEQTNLWPDFLALFDLIDSGKKSYGVPAYNGGLFDQEQHPFLTEKVLPDRWLARIIDQLSRAKDPTNPDLGHFRVDYRDLQIQHLGNVYEGLLELQPHYATEQMRVLRNRKSQRKEETIRPATEAPEEGFEPTGRTYAKGEVYLLTDKGERRASGSYYTPNNIVDYIVEKTLGPLCEGQYTQLRHEIEKIEEEHKRSRGEIRQGWQERLDTLRSDFDNRILRLRILDPAMGSGHFLIRACHYLAEQIATNPFTRDPAADQLSGDESVLVYWKRKVAESCLFGVDLNPMAVELAKLALWLETVAVNHPLTFLDHHLRHGNSLIGASVDDLGAAPGASALWSGFVEQQIKQLLPRLLESLAMIRRIPSDTVDQVKEKDKLFHKSFEPVREPFRQAADAWISAFFLPPGQCIPPEQYKALIDSLDKPAKFKASVQSPPFAAALRAVGPDGATAFHWQLEFPEIFFGNTGLLTDPGFDAIVGNPPYDVLSEKEIGHDISAFQAFVRGMQLYKPSLVDKNNLYKLFICRAISLLAPEGRLGFITPMPLLGDKQASGVRKHMLHTGAFTFIEAFPQKDDPERRIFKEAKLSTVVFGFLRSENVSEKKRSFISRVHPANLIDPQSPSLSLSSATIPLYDPKFHAIVSCSESDWDLAVKIISSGRTVRLATICTSYQGEVNETNEKPKGSLSESPGAGPLVLRGANICVYAVRDASQGQNLYLREAVFLGKKGAESKAYASKQRRVGFQRSAPQNTFRRLIAAIVESGNYCFDTVSYIPQGESSVPLDLLLGLLNSKLIDWYFRLGSTNSKVNEYQFDNLPFPVFATAAKAADHKLKETALAAMAAGRCSEVIDILATGIASPPYSYAVPAVIAEAVQRICAIEQSRGEISRSDRSALAPDAQPYQDLIDKLFYRMAGLTDAEARGLEDRLSRML
jgi:hypothetical protein